MRSLLIRPILPKILPSFKGPGPGICQIQLQWWGWSITMMFAMMMPAMIVMLTMMMNTNGNDWWWGRQGLVSVFGVQMYFPSLLIIFPKSETPKSSFSKYNIFSSTGANPESSDLRLVSPPPVPGDDDYDNHDDYGDGGHKYADHGD